MGLLSDGTFSERKQYNLLLPIKIDPEIESSPRTMILMTKVLLHRVAQR